MAQGFGFVVVVRERRNTLRISSLRAAATEPKNKPATHQVLCVEVLSQSTAGEEFQRMPSKARANRACRAF
jgi:hypothetical protein